MRKLAIIPLLLLAVTLMARPKVNLYFGLRGGAGVMLGTNQLKQFHTTEGTRDIVNHSTNWAISPKAEILLGIKRFHFGYRFMYNYSHNINATTTGYVPVTGTTVDDQRLTAYFSGNRTHMFAHYGVMEYALVNKEVFGLTPGIAIGGYTGFTKNDAGSRVRFSETSRMRLTAGVELNFEFKFKHGAFLITPNYYLFSRQDQLTADWKQFNHFIGAALGFRFSLF